MAAAPMRGYFVLSCALHVCFAVVVANVDPGASEVELPRVRMRLRLESAASPEASRALGAPDGLEALAPQQLAPLERVHSPPDATALPRPTLAVALVTRAAQPSAAAPMPKPVASPPMDTALPSTREPLERKRIRRGDSTATELELEAPSQASAAASADTREATPDPIQSPPPRYPALAIRRKWTGTCVIEALVGADGSVVEVQVIETSGHRILDEAAVDAVRAWRFTPARRGGVAVVARARVPVTFTSPAAHSAAR